MTNRIRKSELDKIAEMGGLAYDTYSPGDGVTRYRFFLADNPTGTDYFGGSRPVHTALGIKKAYQFARAYYTGTLALEVE